MGHAWLRRLSVMTALCTLSLVIAGGLGEQSAHRTIAMPVGILVISLAILLQAKEPRAWVRRAGWSAALSVLLQAASGMALMRVLSTPTAAIAHALLAQVCFGLTAAIAAAQVFPIPSLQGWMRHSPALALAAASLIAQTGLGAALRHQVAGPIPHIVGAMIASILVMWAGLQVLTRHLQTARLRRPAMLLLSLTFSQVFLGVGSAANSLTAAGVPVWVWFRPAHVVVGTLAFGTAILLALLSYGASQLPGNMVHHEGAAIA